MKAPQSIRNLCLAALAVSSVFAGTPAHGQAEIPDYHQLQKYDPREIALLPRYCIYTQVFRYRVPGGTDQVAIDRQYDLMGPTFHHMHHYCWGLMHTNAALYNILAREDRMRRLNLSIDEFDYVIRNATPNFVLLPEIFTRKGENLIRLGRGPLAIQELQRAINLKPDYWPPYAAMSDYYKEFNDLAKAREWLEKGLSVAPDAKGLKTRLAELDGAKGKRTAAPQRPEKTFAPEPPVEKSAAQPAEPQPPIER
jgi:tetratricopeptide (TPR) repeat protein